MQYQSIELWPCEIDMCAPERFPRLRFRSLTLRRGEPLLLSS